MVWDGEQTVTLTNSKLVTAVTDTLDADGETGTVVDAETYFAATDYVRFVALYLTDVWAEGGSRVCDVALQGSPNNSVWTDLITITGSVSTQYTWYEVPTYQYYRYFRILGTTINAFSDIDATWLLSTYVADVGTLAGQVTRATGATFTVSQVEEALTMAFEYISAYLNSTVVEDTSTRTNVVAVQVATKILENSRLDIINRETHMAVSYSNLLTAEMKSLLDMDKKRFFSSNTSAADAGTSYLG